MKYQCTTRLFPLLLLFSACNGQVATEKTELATASTSESRFIPDYGISIEARDSAYTVKCRAVKQQREHLSTLLSKGDCTMDSAANCFTESYLNTILPYWYGTTWAFEGHTSVPKQGEIACGYFVSTTLLHAGVNINRYKVAQQNPINETRTYALTDSLYTFHSPNEVLTNLKGNGFKEGFYFMGMGTNHVGLLLKRRGEIFFLHSNYIDGKTVIEFAETSAVFNNYNAYYITNLSHNKAFIKRWLSKTEIVAVTEE